MILTHPYSFTPYPAVFTRGTYSQNLVLHLPISEGGGAIAHDRTGRNNGTIHGTAAWRSSPIGTSLVLDGSTNWIEIPADPSFNSPPEANGASSYSVWLLWNSSSEAYGLVYGEEDAGNFNTSFFVKQTSGNIAIYDAVGNIDPLPGVALTSGNWYHLVYTYGINAGRSFYINGNRVLQQNNFSSSTIGVNNYRARICGGSIFGSGRYINGAVTNVSKWYRELSPAEVQLLYTTPRSIYLPYRKVWPSGAAGPVNNAFPPYFPQITRILVDGEPLAGNLDEWSLAV